MILKLATREFKNNLKYWLFFTLNLTIGLIGFTFILLFRDNVTTALESKAQTLLSADLAITGRRSLEGSEKELTGKYLQPHISKSSDLTELYSMVTADSGQARLALIKVVDNAFPLVGDIIVKSGEKFSYEFWQEQSKKPLAIISQEVAQQFELKLKDQIKIGKQKFEISHIIEDDSTSSVRGFSLAPHLYIHKNFIAQTELISFGTVAWYSKFYLLKDGLEPDKVKEELQKIITDPAIKVKTPKNSNAQLSRVIGYLTDYLGLIGVVALLISSVGVSYLFQNYLFERLKQVGILKSLGVARKDIISSFMLLVLFSGAFSALIAIISSQLLMPIALNYLENYMDADVHQGLSVSILSVVLMTGIGLNLFTCPPLLFQIFRTKTSTLLMGQLDSDGKLRWTHYVPAFLALWGVAIWQAHSFRIGTTFCVSLLFIFGAVLVILPKVFERVSLRLTNHSLRSPFNLQIGMALRLMTRNKIASVLTILCMAIGFSLVSVIAQFDKGLSQELTNDSTTRPSLFLFDIQQEQFDDLVTFAKINEIPLLPPNPMVRGRLIKKNGEDVKRINQTEGFTTREEDTARRFNNRGVNLSYADSLNDSEEIVDGEEFSGNYSGEGLVEISLEQRYAKRLDVSVGDTLTYNVLGVEIEGKIVNLRKVKWTSFLPNFFIMLQPGVLDEAPKTYLAAIKNVSEQKQLWIQNEVVKKFSNISIINVRQLISKVLIMFETMAWAIGIMSLCCIFVGGFVLFSILQSQIIKKQVDMALQKLMGLGSKEIFHNLLYEYLFMIMISLFFGNLVGVAISYLVGVLFLDGIFAFNLTFFILFDLIALLISSVIIWLSFKTQYGKTVNDLFQD